MEEPKEFNALEEAEKILAKRIQQELIEANIQLFKMFHIAYKEALNEGYSNPEATKLAQDFIQAITGRRQKE